MGRGGFRAHGESSLDVRYWMLVWMFSGFMGRGLSRHSFRATADDESLTLFLSGFCQLHARDIRLIPGDTLEYAV